MKLFVKGILLYITVLSFVLWIMSADNMTCLLVGSIILLIEYVLCKKVISKKELEKLTFNKFIK